jgi:hypothetical protein
LSKNRKDVFSKVAQVKSNARDTVGMPKASFAITLKRDKEPRFKSSLRDLLRSDFEDDERNN